jgi:hypothetical protein
MGESNPEIALKFIENSRANPALRGAVGYCLAIIGLIGAAWNTSWHERFIILLICGGYLMISSQLTFVVRTIIHLMQSPGNGDS